MSVKYLFSFSKIVRLKNLNAHIMYSQSYLTGWAKWMETEQSLVKFVNVRFLFVYNAHTTHKRSRTLRVYKGAAPFMH